MTEPPSHPDRARLRELIDRLSRVVAAQGWGVDLNSVQRAALLYLARANRFSRAPSHVAEYLLATRGTVSQTLKALQRKGLVVERRSETDRRSIAYSLTLEGERLADNADSLGRAIDALDGGVVERMGADVAGLLRGALGARGGRSFGICRTCRHHRATTTPAGGPWCALLDVALTPDESQRICYEHAWADAA